MLGFPYLSCSEVRVNGDYEDFDEADVRFLIPEARRFVDRVAALLPPPAAIHPHDRQLPALLTPGTRW